MCAPSPIALVEARHALYRTLPAWARERVTLDVSTAPPGNLPDISVAGELPGLELKRRAVAAAERVLVGHQLGDEVHLQAQQRLSGRMLARTLALDLASDADLAGIKVFPRGRLPGYLARFWVEVHAEQGVVTLEGFLPDGRLVSYLEACCWNRPGVCFVRNRLEAACDGPERDELLLDVARRLIRREQRLAGAELHLSVHHRVLRLQGRVEGPVERDLAVQDCWAVPGMHGLEQQVEVAA